MQPLAAPPQSVERWEKSVFATSEIPHASHSVFHYDPFHIINVHKLIDSTAQAKIKGELRLNKA